MNCKKCFIFREYKNEEKIKVPKELKLYACIDCGKFLYLKNGIKKWVSKSPNGKWRRKK